MNKQQLISQIKEKKSYLCVGLDTDVTKLPKHLPANADGVLEFNKAIIDATKDFCVSYKINTAFYESLGIKGWEAMEKTLQHIPATHFTIADAKRGDIGNTSAQYAKAFFETLNFDSVTVNPYMGEDSVSPFLTHKNKFAIVLGLTSNKGAADFELLKSDDEYVYEKALKKISSWGNTDNLMFVIGATKSSELINVRKIIPQHFLLVPGVGAQGGSLEEVSKYGMNDEIGLLVNVSRAIIFASDKEDFAEKAGEIAKQYQEEMSRYFVE
jgi:orotidine-5'-phosphate decarboxylase